VNKLAPEEGWNIMGDALDSTPALDWASLSEDEQRIMSSAILPEPLDAVWGIYLPEDEVFLFNRGYKYVPQLAKAAHALLVRGDVILSFKESPESQTVPLGLEDAILAISDLNIWWTYDPNDGAADVEDAGSNPVENGSSLSASRFTFSLPDRGREILNWEDPPRMVRLPRPTHPVSARVDLTDD
jgi:hypothetical protein